MKKITLTLFCCLLLKAATAQVTFTDSNLPIVVVNTNSQTIIDSVKITADMGIIDNGFGNRNYMTDSFNNYSGKIGIEIRGSTSQQYPKKSYGLETRDSLGTTAHDVSLLGMPNENDWILYGAYPDKTLMRNEVTYKIFSQMGQWSPRYVYCELVINGQYIGVYSLMEKIKIDHNRVNIPRLDSNDLAGDSLTGGYIIKIDKPTGSSNTTWTSPYQVKVKYLYHDPQDVDLQPAQKTYIQNYVTAFEDTVYGPNFANPNGGYRQFIYEYSFIDFFLMEELGRTVDGYRSSSFMYKNRDSQVGKLVCGPMWDFNLSYGNADYCAAFDTTGWQYNFATLCPTFSSEPPNWWARLLQDPLYVQNMRCRWQQLRQTVLSTAYVNSLIDANALWLNESQQRNFTQWPILGQYVNWNYFVGNTYQEEVDYLKWWFQSRSEWMDINLPGNCPTVSVPAFGDEEKATVLIYPNPFNSSTTFSITSTNNDDKFLLIYDLAGREVFKKFIAKGENKTTINSNQMSSGMYFYHLKQGEKQIATGKLVME